ncbi:MAG: hypothetical protein JWQ89_261 [Devosia sp.]|uniref:Tim44 domain-containing protein n=1 Tax=Devosia sp. TaxID=1871048 RepID=UPI0026178A7A|nr:Tim44 domain-containing protein [Devosia sp.]MDB5538534.1 hypothetical protein [Devosia sp.]
MFASKGFRISALLATLIMAFSLVAVDTAQARRGGSFGSRGMFTQRSVPATPAAPRVTPPVQRTMTNGTQQNANRVGAPMARPSLFGGFGGALLGGLLFSGLFGMLFGFGFGGFGGMLALLVQVAIIGLIVAFFLRRRQRPAVAGGGPLPYQARNPSPNYGGGPAAASTPRSNASRRAGARDQIGITDADLAVFEKRLAELQDAYSREDYDALRRITTPEVMSYLAEELAENAAKGVRNEVYDVKLLAGDVAEAWRENGTDYATVAMRYESRDVMRDRTTGQVVSGDDRVTQTAEVWTFVRRPGTNWLVSAIQEA